MTSSDCQRKESCLCFASNCKRRDSLWLRGNPTRRIELAWGECFVTTCTVYVRCFGGSFSDQSLSPTEVSESTMMKLANRSSLWCHNFHSWLIRTKITWFHALYRVSLYWNSLCRPSHIHVGYGALTRGRRYLCMRSVDARWHVVWSPPLRLWKLYVPRWTETTIAVHVASTMYGHEVVGTCEYDSDVVSSIWCVIAMDRRRVDTMLTPDTLNGTSP